jgi:NTP pyrophosphatase (non-canonical NTP hydrolase)
MTTASAMNHITAQDVDVLLEAELASHDPAAPARLFTVLQGPARSSPPALHVGCGKMTIGCDALCDEAHGEPSVSSSAVTAPVAPPSLVSPSAATWPQESAATATQPDSTQSSAETVQPTGDGPGDFIVIHGVKLPLAKITTKLTAMGANAVNMTLILFKDEHNDWWENYRSIRDRLISNEMGTHQLVPVQHDSLSIHGITTLLFIRVSTPRQVRGHHEVDLEGVPPRHRPAAHLPGPLGLMQARAAQTAIYPGAGTGDRDARLYTALSLAGEAGEVAGKASKAMRDGESSALMAALYTELGDVFWHWLQCCQEWGAQPDQVAEAMFQRLQDRRRRGTLQGSGDER